jgi:hypothetical protein
MAGICAGIWAGQMTRDFVWLASYPRSGNTFLRTILTHCFGLKSSSIYPNDLGGNKALEDYVGHVDKRDDPDGMSYFPADTVPIFKTHEIADDDRDAIYIVRDGRAATASLWEFFEGRSTKEDIISGNLQFGTWSGHIQSWNADARSNCLFLRYEDILQDLGGVIASLSQYLNQDPIADQIPDRSTIAAIDGKWVRTKSDWRQVLSDEQLERFYKVNGATMSKLGYDQSTPD